jgi:hypothetical protein
MIINKTLMFSPDREWHLEEEPASRGMEAGTPVLGRGERRLNLKIKYKLKEKMTF